MDNNYGKTKESNHQSEKKSLQENKQLSDQIYIFYWESNSDPFNTNQIPTWKSYDQIIKNTP